jgi:hypothetical protein
VELRRRRASGHVSRSVVVVGAQRRCARAAPLRPLLRRCARAAPLRPRSAVAPAAAPLPVCRVSPMMRFAQNTHPLHRLALALIAGALVGCSAPPPSSAPTLPRRRLRCSARLPLSRLRQGFNRRRHHPRQPVLHPPVRHRSNAAIRRASGISGPRSFLMA